MTDGRETALTTARARGDVAAERTCMRCKATFLSEGFGERICARCKSSSSWRSAVSSIIGDGQRRSSGRFS